jgi:hypothetical protein
MPRRARPVMNLVRERRLVGLIKPPAGSSVLEASGVVAKGVDYYVIFDNIRRIARIDPRLAEGAPRNGWFGPARSGDGYEDIAFSPYSRRFYLLIEAEKHPDGTFKGMIDQCDEAGRFKGRHWIDFSFEKRNTGFEGLAVVRRAGKDHLLALCEGNRCRGGRKGRKPGGGRIQVLVRQGRVWKPVACIKLPPGVEFEDYSAVSLRGDRIAVISQMASRLWIGRLSTSDWTIQGQGRLYDFPRTKKGNPRYCTLEGLCWLSDTTFVLVSDLSNRGYRAGCRKRDQSIHVFRLPGAAARD